MRGWLRAVGHGARRRCPRCGLGPLFYRWNRVHDRCDRCDLEFLPDAGGPWAFLLVLDRAVFIFPPVALIYFGLVPRGWPAIVALFGLLVAAIVATTPHRYGVCIALEVLTRGDDATAGIGYPSASSESPEITTNEEYPRGQG